MRSVSHTLAQPSPGRPKNGGAVPFPRRGPKNSRYQARRAQTSAPFAVWHLQMRKWCVYVAAALAPAFCHASLRSDESFRFYFAGVERGIATSHAEANTVSLECDPGFVASAKALITMEGGRAVVAQFVTYGKPALDYVISADGTISSAGKAIARAPFFAPTLPPLLPQLLARYGKKKGGFQSLATVDMAKGVSRTVRVELYRTETRRIGGMDLPMREWRIDASPTPDSVVWTDEHDQPLYWWTPKLNYEVVKQGFDELRVSYKIQERGIPSTFHGQDGQRCLGEDARRRSSDGRRLSTQRAWKVSGYFAANML